MNLDKILDENFFIIDSDNLDSIETKLYGFSIFDNQILFNDILKNRHVELDGTGAYVYLFVNDNDIYISQDMIGSYGIYLFEKEDYFVISNSFVKLVDYVKEKFEISLNYDYATHYIFTDLCTSIYEDTLVNEIRILPRNYKIRINKFEREIYYEEINYEENSIALNSPEGIQLLDKWFDKWYNIIKNLLVENNDISIDLTGGLDSRAVFSLIMASNCDLNNIKINSWKYEHEDYEIASEIANDFNFELNKNLDVEYVHNPSIEELLNISFYTRLGFKKSLPHTDLKPKHPIFHFTGYGGEIIRGYLMGGTIEGSIRYAQSHASNYSKEFENNMKKYYIEKYNKLEKDFIGENKKYLKNRMYKESRMRYHFGRNTIEKFIMNYIYLSPLIDPLLFKLSFDDENCDDTYLVLATIYDRYCPKLLNYKFQNGRKIRQDTLAYVKSINKKYPFQRDKYDLSILKSDKQHSKEVKTNSFEKIEYDEIRNFLQNIFSDTSFKYSFNKYFPGEVYEKVLLSLDSSLGDIYSIISILKIISSIEYSIEKNHKYITDWIKDFSKIPKFPVYDNIIDLGNITLQCPPNFFLNSNKSITDGNNTIYFEIEGNKDDTNIETIIHAYENYVKEREGNSLKEVFIINNILVHKVKNSKSKAIRYWFELNNVIFQIYNYSDARYLDGIIKYLINSINLKNKFILGDIMFLLPPSYEVKNFNSITNGKTTVYFKIVENNKNNLNLTVEYYNKYLNHDKNDYTKEYFEINNIQIQKIKNSKSNLIQYWFEKNNIVYQICCFSTNNQFEHDINYLIANMI